MTTRDNTGALYLGDKVSFVGLRLHVDDDSVMGKIDRRLLSASTAKAMSPASCHARYAGEKLLPREDDPFGVAQVGTAAHHVLEVLYQRPPLERTPTVAIDILNELVASQWDPAAHPGVDEHELDRDSTRWKGEVWSKVEGIWKIEDPAAVDVVRTEWEVSGVSVSDVPFVGFIDRTDRLPDGSLRVVDYKSGKAKMTSKDLRFGDDHGDQVRLYAHALEALTGTRPAEGWIYYLSTGQARRISFDEVHMSRVVDEFRTAWDELKAEVASGSFGTRAGGLCGWCPLVSVCPTARLDGRTAKIPVPSADELGIEVVSESADSTHQEGEVEAPTKGSRMTATYDPTEDMLASMGDPDGAPAAKPARRTRAAAKKAAPAPAVKATPAVKAMFDREPIFSEDKSWVPVSDGLPNGNSYGATGAFGLVELAFEQFRRAGYGQVRPTELKALAGTFARIVADAQDILSGSRNPSDGLATRMRGALRTVIEDRVPPIGSGRDAWESWTSMAVRRCVAVGDIAHTLLTSDIPDAPWLALCPPEGDEADAAA